ELLGAAVRDAESGDDLVEDQYGVVSPCDLAEPFEKSRTRRHDAHVPGHRLDDDRCDLASALAEERLDGVQIVERRGQRQLRERPGYSGTVGNRERRASGAGLHQEAVGVTVV